MNKQQRKLYVQLLIKKEELKLAKSKLDKVSGYSRYCSHARDTFSRFKDVEVSDPQYVLKHYNNLLSQIESEPDIKVDPTDDHKIAAIEYILANIHKELAEFSYENSTLESTFNNVIEEEIEKSIPDSEVSQSKAYILFKKGEVCIGLLKEIKSRQGKE